MTGNEFSIPGFGWTMNTIKRYEKLDIISSGIDINKQSNDDNDYYPSIQPARFLYSYLKSKNIVNEEINSPEEFIEKLTISIKQAGESYFRHQCNGMFYNQYQEFLHSKVSNHRKLIWEIMVIRPNCIFSLHAHPNIEVIFLAKGSFYEYRREGPPIKSEFDENDNIGPNLTSTMSNFIYRPIQAVDLNGNEFEKAFIVNEIGSIHISFTKDEEAILLVLWSGHHAKIPEDQYPPDGSIPILTHSS